MIANDNILLGQNTELRSHQEKLIGKSLKARKPARQIALITPNGCTNWIQVKKK